MTSKVRAAVLAAAVAMLPVLTACSSDPLATTCAEYLKKDAATQLDLATRWGAPNRDHIDEMAKMAGHQYQTDLGNYCPKHPDNKLADLVGTIGIG